MNSEANNTDKNLCLHGAYSKKGNRCGFTNWPPYPEGKEKLEEADPSTRAGGSVCKQGDLLTRPVLGGQKMNRSFTPTWENLNNLYGSLNRFIHIHHLNGLKNTLPSQGYIPGPAPPGGTVGRVYIPRTGEGWGAPAQVRLTGHQAVMSSPLSSPKTDDRYIQIYSKVPTMSKDDVCFRDSEARKEKGGPPKAKELRNCPAWHRQQAVETMFTFESDPTVCAGNYTLYHSSTQSCRASLGPFIS